MEKRMKKTGILVAALLIAIALMPSMGGWKVSAADSGKAAYDDVMSLETPDNYSDETFEPYGYGVDVPFMMNKQAELLFYQTRPGSGGVIDTFYDSLKPGSSADVLGGNKTRAMAAPPDDLQQAYFVKAVAFDPTGTGRDDHIAFIGIYWDSSQNARAGVWAYNTRTNSWLRGLDLGSWAGYNCNWMRTEKITEYEAMGFLSITAGDYNGDGKDTIVAYAAFSGADGYSLYELEATDTAVGYFGDKSKGSELRHDWYGDWVCKKDKPSNKMSCELDTGDVNGDGLDDLVALTYIGNWGDTSQPGEFYRPMVTTSLGRVGASGFTQRYDTYFGTWKWVEGWKWDNMVSPGLSLGDVNNDGTDEIVVAGIKCLTKKKSQDTTEICNEIDGDKNTFVVIADVNGNYYYAGTQATNAWMKSGFYTNENVWNKSAVECVAVNGLGNPEMIFINGTLYKFDHTSGALDAVHTPDYFQNDGDNLSSKASTNMYIQSTAAGNFDANAKGYEQVAFTVSCKTNGKRSYDYLRGVIGGKSFHSTTGQAQDYYSTSKGNMDDDHAWPGRGKDNASGYIDEKQGLNCIVVAADNDNDGFMARYKEKSLLAADPEVLCVLQAPPYFSKVKDYLTDTSGTTYEITESYAFDKTKSDSISFGVGIVSGMETPAVQMEVTEAYALDWSKEFTEGQSESVTIGYTATEEDLVLVQKKPVIAYYYEIQSQNGDWSGEQMVVTVPCEPGLETMGISKYNAFATYYNKQLEKSQYLKEYQNKSDVPDYMKTTHKLGILNNKWLGHEGDPQSYIKWTNKLFKTDSAYRILQKSPMKFGHNSEAVSWGKTAGTSIGVTESMSHGFTFDATVAAGPNAGVSSFYVGLSTSLQYMTGESTTKTETKEQGIACTVNGLKVKDMPADMRGDDYNFSFKMARWPSGLKRYVNGKAEDIPVYGYALSSVTVPVEDENITVEDQLNAAEVEEMISDVPVVGEITLENEAEIEAIRDKYEALSVPAKTLVDERDILELEDRIKLIKAGGLDLTGAAVKLSKTAFTYNGKVQKPVIKTVGGYCLVEGLDYTAKWSNKSSKNAGTYTVTLTGKGICSGSVKVTYKINKAANTMTAKGKTVKLKYKKLKKKAQTIARSKAITVSKAQGTQTYKLVSVKKAKFKKYFKVDSKTGKITVKKKLKKGTYTLKIKVRCAGNTNYKPSAWKTVTVKVKVK